LEDVRKETKRAFNGKQERVPKACSSQWGTRGGARNETKLEEASRRASEVGKDHREKTDHYAIAQSTRATTEGGERNKTMVKR